MADRTGGGCNRCTKSLERTVKLSGGAPVLSMPSVRPNVHTRQCMRVGLLRAGASEASDPIARKMVIRVMIGCPSPANHKSDYKICANSSLAARDSGGEKCLMSSSHFFPPPGTFANESRPPGFGREASVAASSAHPTVQSRGSFYLTIDRF